MQNGHLYGGSAVVEVLPIKLVDLALNSKISLKVKRNDYLIFLSAVITKNTPVEIILNNLRIGTDYGARVRIESIEGNFIKGVVLNNLPNNENYIEIDSSSKLSFDCSSCAKTNCEEPSTKTYNYVHFDTVNMSKLKEMEETIIQLEPLLKNLNLLKNFLEVLKKQDPTLSKIDGILS